jgi:hypothetical protein
MSSIHIFQQRTPNLIYGSKIQDDSYARIQAGQTNHADIVGDMCFQCMVPCPRYGPLGNDGWTIHRMV